MRWTNSTPEQDLWMRSVQRSSDESGGKIYALLRHCVGKAEQINAFLISRTICSFCSRVHMPRPRNLRQTWNIRYIASTRITFLSLHCYVRDVWRFCPDVVVTSPSRLTFLPWRCRDITFLPWRCRDITVVPCSRCQVFSEHVASSNVFSTGRHKRRLLRATAFAREWLWRSAGAYRRLWNFRTS